LPQATDLKLQLRRIRSRAGLVSGQTFCQQKRSAGQEYLERAQSPGRVVVPVPVRRWQDKPTSRRGN
jgi:hypothetical protein